MKTVHARDQRGRWTQVTYDDGATSPTGTEGHVYRTSNRAFVIKLFKSKSATYLAEKAAKLRVMLAPEMVSYFVESREQPDFAWPICTIHNSRSDDVPLGFGMRNLVGYESLSELFSSTSPIGKAFTGFHRATICAYIAHLFAVCHAKTFLIADVKPDNIQIHPATHHVAIIDCDSFQVSHRGALYTSNVGTRDYISPRLLAALGAGSTMTFRGVRRERSDDEFALAVITFQIMMGGYHPFKIRNTGAKTQSTIYNIKGGVFPYAGSSAKPPRLAPTDRYGTLSQDLQTMFKTTFTTGRSPAAQLWRNAFHKHAQSLRPGRRWFLTRSTS